MRKVHALRKRESMPPKNFSILFGGHGRFTPRVTGKRPSGVATDTRWAARAALACEGYSFERAALENSASDHR